MFRVVHILFLIVLALACAVRPELARTAPADRAPAAATDEAAGTVRDATELAAEQPASAPTPLDPELARSVEAEYGFDRTSPYPTLLDVLRRAQAAIVAGIEPERARAARFLAMSYVAPADKLRVQHDFVLQQPSFEDKASAALEIRWIVEGRSGHDPALIAAIADKLCADLANIRERNGVTSAFISHALSVLLLLEDDRALDIALTDTLTMRNLQRRDGWSPDDAPQFFRDLAASYRQDLPEYIARAVLYEMIAERLASGGSLTAQHPVFDLEQYKRYPAASPR